MPSTPPKTNTPPPPPPLPAIISTTSRPANADLSTVLQGKVIKQPAAGFSEIWLCCYRSYLFAGHWLIFVPSKVHDGCGTVINVQGNPKEGFQHEFERLSRPPWSSVAGPARFHLANINDAWISPEATYPPDEATVDTEPVNDLEKSALRVPAPVPSLNPAQGPAVSVLILE